MGNAHTLQQKYNLQASFWIVWEFSAETRQSAMQKLTLQQREVVRFTHVPPKTQNWAYSGLENKEPQNLSRNIYGRILSFFLFAEKKCRHTKYTQIVRVNY